MVMRTTPAHVAPGEAGKRRRRTTRTALAGAVAVALGGSGIYVANASAAETVVPGRVQAESYAAQSGAQVEGTGGADGGKNVGWLAAGDWLRYDNVSVAPVTDNVSVAPVTDNVSVTGAGLAAR